MQLGRGVYLLGLPNSLMVSMSPIWFAAQTSGRSMAYSPAPQLAHAVSCALLGLGHGTLPQLKGWTPVLDHFQNHKPLPQVAVLRRSGNFPFLAI